MDSTTTILVACLSSAGLWAVVQSIIAYFIEKKKAKDNKNNITREEFEVMQRALRGLLYGELELRCSRHIHDGHISAGELNDLRRYYYEPYKGLGGDGTIDNLMGRVEKLNIEE